MLQEQIAEYLLVAFYKYFLYWNSKYIYCMYTTVGVTGSGKKGGVILRKKCYTSCVVQNWRETKYTYIFPCRDQKQLW